MDGKQLEALDAQVSYWQSIVFRHTDETTVKNVRSEIVAGLERLGADTNTIQWAPARPVGPDGLHWIEYAAMAWGPPPPMQAEAQ